MGAALAGAASFLIASGPQATARAASDPFTVGCYDTASQSADVSVVAFKGNPGMTAEELCRTLWQGEGHAHQDVVACVVSAGGLSVFPNHARVGAAELCAAIGASLPDDGPVYQGLSAEAVRALDRVLATRYEATWAPGHTCGKAGVLRALAIEALAEVGAERWRVVDESSGPNACAHPRVEALAGRVVLERG